MLRVVGTDPVRSLVDAEPVPFWLDDAARPAPSAALAGEEHCDLAVVGGGYCGLWTALLAKERDPDRDVVLIEAREIGWAASGRNGGFCSSSLTHGLGNGLARWPDELAELQRLGRSTTSARGSPATSTSAPAPSGCSRRTSSTRSPSSKASGSPTRGAARSTPAAGSRRSSAPPPAAASATRSGFTGLGVAATRFAAQVVLDRLDGLDTPRTRLRMVRGKPVPFPPEPLRWAGIELTRRSMARADLDGGRRGPWLRTMDALGLGFDS